jgi:type II secretion system protein H
MRRDAGFSLVEVMVALFLAALGAAAVIASIPPPVPEEEQAAQRLAAALTRAQRAAVIEGAAIGLDVAAAGYGFVVWDNGDWRGLDRASGLGGGDWPSGALGMVEGEAASEAPEGFPDLVFDETGGATPFLIRIVGARHSAAVRGDAAGAIAVETPDA